MDENAQYQKEILEAIEAANVALNALEQTRTDLKSASGWGIVDMIGGGLISSLFKHSNIDDAKKHMEQARQALYRFSKELKDVDAYLDLDIDLDGFVTFVDVFMDNVFVDFMVQSKIENARRQVDDAIYKVEKLKEQLSQL